MEYIQIMQNFELSIIFIGIVWFFKFCSTLKRDQPHALLTRHRSECLRLTDDRAIALIFQRPSEVFLIMLNQKLPHAPSEEMTIDIDLLYEMDPCELKLDEMIEAEPEPEMIEGLPASDALTPADR